ncbi:hypothetical protein [Sphingomonas crusticola]|uniref:hypothetical protein n=1 Tax=Sphingomonas crusticola TaxID=1697973 RepID=UPI000E220776|nr:hypothetical protein [Sphingomonas crusticola]
MTIAAARGVLALAVRCLGTDRGEWGLAMEAEFETAVEDGKPLVFASGCLIAAWREMVRQGEGRLVLAKYALALGLLLPMAVLQFERAIGFSSFFWGAAAYGMPGSGAGPNPYLVWSQISAVPVLLILWLSLAMAHLGLAWVVVDGDWPRVVKFVALIGAATITLFLFMGVLLLDLSPLISQGTALAIELAAIVAAARWHARLFSAASPELLAR